MKYYLLGFLAAAGLVASLICHIMALFHADPPWGHSVMFLHLGIFVVWIPLVFIADKTSPDQRRGNLDHLLKELPKWATNAAGAVFTYAIVNFVLFIIATTPYPKGQVPFYVELRGFSGHWMLFYGIALLGFSSMAIKSKHANAG